ncbi:hypothetical protein UFOVP235_50 [uncultured Caudovirales phage]|uniref:Uncharacterized protein n=1 Tax=uncultured Caudovirales phage TaxID=2100421 RepID=A0A6J7WZD8_9CAUD|nr:hypothetical protein UFOVP235_50 [uncultured Caudovirales phage]
MDVLTILATAKTAHATIKAAIGVGRDLSSLASELSDLMHGTAQITRIAASPPRSWLNRKSAEALALEAFAAKQEALNLEYEVRSLVVSAYGLRAWESIQRDVINIRKEQQAEAIIAARRKREQLEIALIITFTILTLGVVITVIDFIATYQPRSTFR